MAVTPFQDLPLADRDRAWDRDNAEKRVRRWADARDAPNDRYRRAFVWYEAGEKDEFGAHKLPIARVKSHLAKYYSKMGDTPPWDD